MGSSTTRRNTNLREVRIFNLMQTPETAGKKRDWAEVGEAVG